MTKIDDQIERARFLASGQDDPHSVTIDMLCDRLEELLVIIRETFARHEGGAVLVSWREDYDVSEEFPVLREIVSE